MLKEFDWQPAVRFLKDAEPYLKKHISIRFMKHHFDVVTALSTERKHGTLILIHGQLVSDNAAKTSNGFPHTEYFYFSEVFLVISANPKVMNYCKLTKSTPLYHDLIASKFLNSVYVLHNNYKKMFFVYKIQQSLEMIALYIYQ